MPSQRRYVALAKAVENEISNLFNKEAVVQQVQVLFQVFSSTCSVPRVQFHVFSSKCSVPHVEF